MGHSVPVLAARGTNATKLVVPTQLLAALPCAFAGGANPQMPLHGLAAAVHIVLQNTQRFRTALANCSATVAEAEAHVEHVSRVTPTKVAVHRRAPAVPADAKTRAWCVPKYWKPHEVEVVVKAVVAARTGTAPNADSLLKELGWDTLPDQKLQRQRVSGKLAQVRASLGNGVDPEQVSAQKKKTRQTLYTWEAWLRNAFTELPDRQGTVDDVCKLLQADVNIAPLLDNRPSEIYRQVPQWRNSVFKAIARLQGLTNTGVKRGGLAVYKYDPEAHLKAGKRKRAPQSGQAVRKRSRSVQ